MALATYMLLFLSLYFEVFMLLSFLERKFTRRAPAVTSALAKWPSVAIAVPCYNESRTIRGTLESLLALDYPADKLEIVVVDDGSTDETHRIASELARSNPRLKVLHKQNGGKHTAMNVALAHTKAELIGCLDADSVVERDALRHIVPVFADARVGAVTPGIHVKEPKTWLQHLQYTEYRISLFNRYVLSLLGAAFITPGPFSIFRTAVIRELDGWRHGHSTEDMEMALRMQLAGHVIANAPRAVVHTATPSHLRALIRQRVRWTYGWLRNAVDYRRMIGNRELGTLGLIVLPSALISVVTVLFFSAIILMQTAHDVYREYTRIALTGALPHPVFDLFYLNTSAIQFIIWTSIGLILSTIIIGSMIGTSSRRPPASTPLFILLYGFLVPVWVGVALVRATFKTGVRWR